MQRGISLENVACVRGGRELFSGLSLSLNAGGAALITGPNGTGKSTLLRVIAGLLRPSAGVVKVEGALALADSRDALDDELPLAAALGFWARLDGSAKSGLAAMGIAHLATVPVRMLSSGQLQRGALARVIASNADIWLLDEPSNALDTDGVALLEAAIASHRAAGGIAIVASHLAIALPDSQTLVLGA